MVMLRWCHQLRETGHVTEVESLMEGERSCYRVAILIEGE